MLWIKSPHLVFVASWLAGLSDVPRIFVNLVTVPALGLPACLVVAKPF